MTEPISQPRAHHPEELVQLFSGEIWRFVSSQIPRKEDAEDIVMEVFAAAFGEFSKLQRVESQRLWLLAVARRKIADALRRQYRRAERPYSEAEESTWTSPLDETQLATRGALERLSKYERQALVLKYVNGLSTEEVSHVLRRSTAATNSLLQRARHSFRAALGPRLAETSGETR